MSLQAESILLSRIDLDPFFKKDEDERLTFSLKKDNLLEPLIVEAHSEGQYILVDGYKRYASLKKLGWNEAPCIIEDPTDLAGLIAKRLKRDFNKRKMKNPERVRLVHKLLSFHWDEKRIAQVTGISISIIRKYKKIRNIPQERRDKVESLGLGQEGLLSLENIRHRLSSKNYAIVIDILESCDKLYYYNIRSIEYLSKVSGFNELPESSIKHAVEKAIKGSKYTISTAGRDVVLEQVVSNSTRNALALGIALDYVLEQSEQICRHITSRLVQFAPSEKRQKLISNLELGLQKAKTESYSWRPFNR